MTPAGRRLSAGAISLAVHAALIAILLGAHRDTAQPPEPPAMTVALVQPAPVAPAPAPVDPEPAPALAKPPPPRHLARLTPPRPNAVSVPAGKGPTADGDDLLSEAQVAGAATAGGGSPGGACDMPRRLQAALRKDGRVQAAVAEAHRGERRALLVWNGDWIRSQGQDGDGLAAVREAIMWEVGFSPEACRVEPVHGMVLISLSDAPGAARLVVGSGAWRWSDLLGRLHR